MFPKPSDRKPPASFAKPGPYPDHSGDDIHANSVTPVAEYMETIDTLIRFRHLCQAADALVARRYAVVQRREMLDKLENLVAVLEATVPRHSIQHNKNNHHHHNNIINKDNKNISGSGGTSSHSLNTGSSTRRSAGFGFQTTTNSTKTMAPDRTSSLGGTTTHMDHKPQMNDMEVRGRKENKEYTEVKIDSSGIVSTPIDSPVPSPREKGSAFVPPLHSAYDLDTIAQRCPLLRPITATKAAIHPVATAPRDPGLTSLMKEFGEPLRKQLERHARRFEAIQRKLADA